MTEDEIMEKGEIKGQKNEEEENKVAEAEEVTMADVPPTEGGKETGIESAPGPSEMNKRKDSPAKENMDTEPTKITLTAERAKKLCKQVRERIRSISPLSLAFLPMLILMQPEVIYSCAYGTDPSPPLSLLPFSCLRLSFILVTATCLGTSISERESPKTKRCGKERQRVRYYKSESVE